MIKLTRKYGSPFKAIAKRAYDNVSKEQKEAFLAIGKQYKFSFLESQDLEGILNMMQYNHPGFASVVVSAVIGLYDMLRANVCKGHDEPCPRGVTDIEKCATSETIKAYIEFLFCVGQAFARQSTVPFACFVNMAHLDWETIESTIFIHAQPYLEYKKHSYLEDFNLLVKVLETHKYKDLFIRSFRLCPERDEYNDLIMDQFVPLLFSAVHELGIDLDQYPNSLVAILRRTKERELMERTSFDFVGGNNHVEENRKH